MSARTLLVAALCVASPLALSACKNSKGDTNAPLATDGSDASDTGTDTQVTRTPVPQGELVEVTVSIAALDDMFAGLKKFGERWVPDSPIDPGADAQAMLLGLGFGPGFWQNIDFSGTHALFVAAPAEGEAGPGTMEFAGSLAVVDANKLLESTPADYRPQPLGDGMWELNRDGERMLMRDGGKELLVGYTTADLDRAAKLRGQVGEGRRLRARATNIPVDDFDPAALLGLPRDQPIVQALSAVLKELEAFEFEAEFGSDRDTELVASAEAPFHKLGLGPIGKPRAASTAIEGRLPGDPVFVTSMSWGDPKLVHAMMDKSIPAGAIPAPFDKMVEQAVSSMHSLLDQLSNDIVLAMYVDKQGRATLVFAADVKDDAAAIAAVRGLNGVIVQGIDAQKALAGKDAAAAFDAKVAEGKAKFGSVRADQLTVTIPASFEEDFEAAGALLAKNKLEAYTVVAEGAAVVAIGAGAKGIVSDVARSMGKARRDSLAQHEGLGRLRKAMGGCQICISGDPSAYFRFRLAHLRDTSDDKAIAKAAKGKLAELDKTEDLGDPGFGLRVADEDASVAIVVPQSLVFAAPATAEKLMSLGEFLSEPSAAAAPEPTSKSKPKK